MRQSLDRVSRWCQLCAVLLLMPGVLAGMSRDVAAAGSDRAVRPYQLTPDERKLDCRALAGAVTAQIAEIKTLRLKARKEQLEPAPSLTRMFARMSGPPGSGIAALEEIAYARAKADAFNAELQARRCKTILIDAELASVERPSGLDSDRCTVRNEFGLSDCIEDIAHWRCRNLVKDATTYVECLDYVARRAIKASGYDASRVGLYGPECAGQTFSAAGCSVFTNGRPGAGREWCQRQTENEIKICDAARTKCRTVTCRLGTCERLCTPPGTAATPAPATGFPASGQHRKGGNAQPG